MMVNQKYIVHFSNFAWYNQTALRSLLAY